MTWVIKLVRMALIRYKYNGKEEVSSDVTVTTTVESSQFTQNSGEVRLSIYVLGDETGKRVIGENVYITLIEGNVSYLSTKSNSIGEFDLVELDTANGTMKGNFEILYKLEGGDKLIKSAKFES